ncbi:hypothetical protein J4450_01700 [Candidatus Micrarchaeota archaeon]|nr:hypothetical protein [Candidatus Micrarchaeota archaeon]
MQLDFFQAYLVTISVESILLYMFLGRRYVVHLLVGNSILVNTITLPFVWFFFPLIKLDYTTRIIVAEFFAFIAETILYLKLFKKLRFFDAVYISFFCNLCSFILGFILQLTT